MQMTTGLDSGPVYAAAEVPIGPTTTVSQLHDVLAELGARTLTDVLPALGTHTPMTDRQKLDRTGLLHLLVVEREVPALGPDETVRPLELTQPLQDRDALLTESSGDEDRIELESAAARDWWR